MIDPVIYGPTPSMMIERFESPPPEKIFKIPKNWLLFKNLERATVSIPGIGIEARSLKTINEPSTNKIRFLKDGSTQINFTFSKNFCILFYFFDTTSDFF